MSTNKKDKLVIELLNHFKQFEDAEMQSKRKQVLKELENIINKWVFFLSCKLNREIDSTKQDGAKVFPFGSYRLNVHSPGGDIDAVCLVPDWIKREDFFTKLQNMLKSKPQVSELVPVSDAQVPVLKLKFDGVDIDLLFSKLPMDNIPKNLDSLQDDAMLLKMTKECILSANGKRMTDILVTMVKDRKELFEQVLKFIKLWAKNRGIQGNQFGFLGGVSYSILATFVFNLDVSNCSAAQGLVVFFQIMADWKWPTPVILEKIKEVGENWPFKTLLPWNPKKNQHDTTHAMPIITPSFPAFNTTYNVNQQHLRIITQEFHRAYDILKDVHTLDEDSIDFQAQFNQRIYQVAQEYFFDEEHFTNFLLVNIVSTNADDQSMWNGVVQSRMRKFLQENLQDLFDGHYVRPIPREYKQPFDKQQHSNLFLIGMGLNPDKKAEEQDIQPVILYFVQKCKEFNSYNEDTMNILIKVINRNDLFEMMKNKLINRA